MHGRFRGYTRITSPFGKRVSPTAGASNYHKGIDIGAPEGTILIAAIDGEITYLGFLGDKVKRGQIIGQVGPKNVYGVKGNNYKDENGNPTNGATTGCHLHFGVRVNEEYQNPLDFYKEEKRC